MLPLYSVMFNTIGYFQAAGKALSAALLVSAVCSCFYVPLQLIFPALFGKEGLWYCNPGSDVVSMVLVVFMIPFPLGAEQQKDVRLTEYSLKVKIH